jgi:hypothetical protein
VRYVTLWRFVFESLLRDTISRCEVKARGAPTDLAAGAPTERPQQVPGTSATAHPHERV